MVLHPSLLGTGSIAAQTQFLRLQIILKRNQRAPLTLRIANPKAVNPSFQTLAIDPRLHLNKEADSHELYDLPQGQHLNER